MEYTEYTAAADKCSVTVPVMIGGEAACRMNLFYAAALDELLRYGTQLTENQRSRAFFCRCTVEEQDDRIFVTLFLTLRRPGETSLRKTIVHSWKDGYPAAAEKRRRVRKPRHSQTD